MLPVMQLAAASLLAELCPVPILLSLSRFTIRCKRQTYKVNRQPLTLITLITPVVPKDK